MRETTFVLASSMPSSSSTFTVLGCRPISFFRAEEVLAENPGEFDPRYYLKPARAAMQEVVRARMEAFGQAGHAKDYDPISLEDMVARYKEQGHQLTTA